MVRTGAFRSPGGGAEALLRGLFGQVQWTVTATESGERLEQELLGVRSLSGASAERQRLCGASNSAEMLQRPGASASPQMLTGGARALKCKLLPKSCLST